MKKNRKLVCVLGLGSFGMELARTLAEHCEVFALDSDEERIDMVSEWVQRAMCLDGRDLASLQAVVTADFDEAVVGVGGSLESSILCTLHLKKIGVKRIRAKAASDDHAAILRAVGADEIVYPERETAHRLANRIANPNLLDFIPLAEDYVVMDLMSPRDFHGRTLADLQLPGRAGAYVIAVKAEKTRTFHFLPGPQYTVQPGDVLMVIGREQNLLKLREEGSGG